MLSSNQTRLGLCYCSGEQSPRNLWFYTSMNITIYRKSGCPWSAAVMGFLNEMNIPYGVKNITSNPQYAEELQLKSGQTKSPTIDLDGTILADASVEDVAKALEERGIVI
jgi:glutaredoxin